MPIIFFIISLFLANQNAITISPKGNGTTIQKTVKNTGEPTGSEDFIIGNDINP
ncbi:MAG: hypothetical protein LCH81_16845 [Bacteroidetes bacterium]|nr:hypothetical protein [Bacteroidota bacterium]